MLIQLMVQINFASKDKQVDSSNIKNNKSILFIVLCNVYP